MIVETLLAAAEHGGGRPAVADPFRGLDYGNLVRFADVMRRQVERATTNAHVGIMLPSCCAFAGAFYGVLWAGRVAVPLNFLLQPAELQAVVADAGIDTVFTIKHFREQVEVLPVRVIYVEDLPLKREMALGYVRRRPPPPQVRDDDLAVLLYTSGTSGVPKGVRQTYKNLRSDIDASIEKARLTTEHRFIGVLPQFHSFGLTALLLIPVALAAPVYYIPRFQPLTVLDAIREQRSSIAIMVASMFTAMLRAKRGGREDLASIEYPISGGEALSNVIFDQFRDRFGIEILQGYGMTEASPIVSLNVPWSNRVGTVGQPIPGVTVTAFDDQGNQLAAGQTGELWIRGPIVMQGYYRKEAETREAITADGWYKTGDMGTVDADGYITITGRKKEMIIVGGENVYPREVETVLEQHPAVAEAAVIGQMDPSRGEVVVAFVMPAEGQQLTELALRDFCRGRIAGYKIPRRIIMSDNLPRGPTGKILKRRLSELL
ncbi:MAG TPA: AMP-binding protein [Phycisphaerae bacterium]|nr:AMP-binding protein [Phycisphaerae bacterium]